MFRERDSPKSKKTPAKKSSGARSAGGRPTKYDWTALRREYIRGDDTITLASLAAIARAPSARQLERRCAAEDWADLRLQLRREVDGRLRAVDVDLKTEVRVRQAKIGKAFMTLAVRGMAHQDPSKMDAIDVARFAKIGAELERKALGMEELNVNLGRVKSPDDLDRLSEAELWKIAGMLPPDESDDPDF
ncbi:hypothetical protein [Deinococcus sp. QL22]|uniref:hypothetical protein n=1 Tax=Deinococcus sp. QL22 TaxID=2939437 RepID=UPI0020170A98|nr:hypothetical protein [Deinococcus sp. QL22]UQN06303.1 hypothetical protein M1R55_15810 [Deinococcus sp. QL22]